MRRPRVPASVLVLAILGLIFCAWGIIGLALTAAMLFGFSYLPGGNQGLGGIFQDQGYLIGTGIMTGVGFLLLLVLLVSSIGSLTLRPWARRGMLAYAVLTILNGLAGMAFTFFYVVPLTLAQAPGGGQGQAAAAGGAIGGALGGVCGGLIGMIYPVCVLIFFNRPHVIDAFNGISPPEWDEDEEAYDDDYEEERRQRNRERRRLNDGESDQITTRPGE